MTFPKDQEHLLRHKEEQLAQRAQLEADYADNASHLDALQSTIDAFRQLQDHWSKIISLDSTTKTVTIRHQYVKQLEQTLNQQSKTIDQIKQQHWIIQLLSLVWSLLLGQPTQLSITESQYQLKRREYQDLINDIAKMEKYISNEVPKKIEIAKQKLNAIQMQQEDLTSKLNLLNPIEQLESDIERLKEEIQLQDTLLNECKTINQKNIQQALQHFLTQPNDETLNLVKQQFKSPDPLPDETVFHFLDRVAQLYPSVNDIPESGFFQPFNHETLHQDLSNTLEAKTIELDRCVSEHKKLSARITQHKAELEDYTQAIEKNIASLEKAHLLRYFIERLLSTKDQQEDEPYLLELKLKLNTKIKTLESNLPQEDYQPIASFFQELKPNASDAFKRLATHYQCTPEAYQHMHDETQHLLEQALTTERETFKDASELVALAITALSSEIQPLIASYNQHTNFDTVHGYKTANVWLKQQLESKTYRDKLSSHPEKFSRLMLALSQLTDPTNPCIEQYTPCTQTSPNDGKKIHQELQTNIKDDNIVRAKISILNEQIKKIKQGFKQLDFNRPPICYSNTVCDLIKRCESPTQSSSIFALWKKTDPNETKLRSALSRFLTYPSQNLLEHLTTCIQQHPESLTNIKPLLDEAGAIFPDISNVLSNLNPQTRPSKP